jgi:hypothetical protein
MGQPSLSTSPISKWGSWRRASLNEYLSITLLKSTPRVYILIYSFQWYKFAGSTKYTAEIMPWALNAESRKLVWQCSCTSIRKVCNLSQVIYFEYKKSVTTEWNNQFTPIKFSIRLHLSEEWGMPNFVWKYIANTYHYKFDTKLFFILQ